MVSDRKCETTARNARGPLPGARPQQFKPDAPPARLLAADFLASDNLFFWWLAS